MKQQWVENDHNITAKIDALIVAQNYAEALTVLSRIQDKQSNSYQSLENKLYSSISEFEKNTISEANIYADKNELLSALNIVEESLRKIPNSKNLRDLHVKLSHEKARKLKEVHTNLLLLEAGYLFDRLKWFREEKRLSKISTITHWKMSNMEIALENLREQFLDCHNEYKNGDMSSLALECLQMALVIKPDKALEKTLSKPVKIALPEDVSEFKKAKAKDIPQILPPEDIQEKQVLKVESELADKETSENPLSATAKLIEQYMKQGSDHYRAGRVSKARDAWRKVLELNSEHQEAIQQISRAEKILKKLDNLKEEQTSDK